jgi:hypothetical protein
LCLKKFKQAKVKFKGPNVTFGSNSVLSAVVPIGFMSNITPLNKLILNADLKEAVSRKGAKGPKKRVATGDPSAEISAKYCHLEKSIAERVHTPLDNHASLNPRSLCGCLALLPGNETDLLSRSLYFAKQSNKKLFNSLLETFAQDPGSVEINCSYDFWLWIDAQRIFAPLSNKTHNLSYIEFQGTRCKN